MSLKEVFRSCFSVHSFSNYFFPLNLNRRARGSALLKTAKKRIYLDTALSKPEVRTKNFTNQYIWEKHKKKKLNMSFLALKIIINFLQTLW